MDMDTLCASQTELARLLTKYTNNIFSQYIHQLQYRHPSQPLNKIQIDNSLPVLEAYFNDCAASLYDRNDEWINTYFDEMLAINVGKKYNPIELLHYIVNMFTRGLRNINLDCTYGKNIDEIFSYICGTGELTIDAAALGGISEEYSHIKISRGEKYFSLNPG